MKMQLDAEIELYRNILNEAEQCAGYKSPFHSVQKGANSRNSRKRKRFNHSEVEMEHNALQEEMLNADASNAPTNAASKVRTPGVARAAKMAHSDVAEVLSSPFSECGMEMGGHGHALDPVSELEARHSELELECKDREDSAFCGNQSD